MVIGGEIRIPVPGAQGSLAALLLAVGVGFGGCTTTLAQFEPAREVVCFESTKVSLKDAVAAAEKQGGRVIDAHYHQADEMGCLVNKPGYYDVTLLDQGKVVSVTVDVHSSEVAVRSDPTTLWDRTGQYLGRIFARDPVPRARMASTMAMGMQDAIASAEKTRSGKTMKAYIDTRGGKPGYTLKLVERGRVRMAWVAGG
jgi:hypothetical protein